MTSRHTSRHINYVVPHSPFSENAPRIGLKTKGQMSGVNQRPPKKTKVRHTPKRKK